MYFVGIDFGLSYLKICLIDEQGNERKVNKYQNVYKTDDGTFQEFDLGKIYKSIVRGIREIKLYDQKDFEEIKHISVSTHGSTMFLIDKKGKELMNGISVFDIRAKKEASFLSEKVTPEDNYLISGHNKITEVYPAAKILWLKNNKKEIFQEINKILFPEDYILYKISGKILTEKSMASISGLYNINKDCWREDLIDILGVKKELLPELIEAGTVIGNISKKFSEDTGLNPKINISTGLLDALANSLGAGNYEQNKIVECTGTVLSIIANTDKPAFNKLQIPINYFINNKYSLLPYTPTAGVIIDWFGKNFYKSKKYYNLIDKDIADYKPDINKLYFLPYLLNTSIINEDINSRGLFFGINLSSSKKDFISAINESIGFLLKENVDEIEKITSKKDYIISVGGATNNVGLCQLKSDILNKKLFVTKNKEVGCLGVSLLSSIANGCYKDLSEATDEMVQIIKIYDPQKKYFEIYKERFKRYKEILKNTIPLYKKYYN